MQYMTIIHELLQQQPQTYKQLCGNRKILATVQRYARELKASHEAWKKMLTPLRPGSHPVQIASEALEIALKEIEDRLPNDSHQESDPLVLDAAMLFLRRHTRRG